MILDTLLAASFGFKPELNASGSPYNGSGRDQHLLDDGNLCLDPDGVSSSNTANKGWLTIQSSNSGERLIEFKMPNSRIYSARHWCGYSVEPATPTKSSLSRHGRCSNKRHRTNHDRCSPRRQDRWNPQRYTSCHSWFKPCLHRVYLKHTACW